MGYIGAVAFMVLKHLLTFLFLLIALTQMSGAQQYRSRRFGLKSTFYSKDYKQFHYRFTHLKKPLNRYKSRNLEKFAILLEKKEKYRESREVYWQLMAIFHLEDFKKFVRFLKKRTPLPEELGEKFIFYLYRQTFLEYKRYKETYDLMKSKSRKTLRRKIKKMQEILADLEFEEEDLLDELEEDIDLFDKIEAQKVYHKHWVFSLSQTMYKGELNLQRDSDGQNNEIISSERLFNIGLSWQKENYFFLYKVGFQVLTGTGSVQNGADANVSYFQDGVATSAFSLNPGFLWKFEGGEASFGFEFPVYYQVGDFESPDTHSFESTNRFSFGVAILNRWMISDTTGLEFSFGKLTGMESAVWNIGGLYKF